MDLRRPRLKETTRRVVNFGELDEIAAMMEERQRREFEGKEVMRLRKKRKDLPRLERVALVRARPGLPRELFGFSRGLL